MNQKIPAEPKGCVLIPAYLEERRIQRVIQDVLKYIPTIVVIVVGAPDRTAAEASAAGATVIKHEKNLGKGAALNTGFAYAGKQHFDYVITMDADGQHSPDDIPGFVETFRRTGVPALVGNRMANPGGMPLVRKLTNIFMSWYLSRQMGQRVPDTQCGFRLYAARILPHLTTKSNRYAAESETLLRAAAQNITIGHVPIRVIYRDEKSKIRPFRDTIRFFRMVRHFRKEIRSEQKEKWP